MQLFTALTSEAERHVDNLNALDLAKKAKCFVKAGHQDAQLLTALARAAELCTDECTSLPKPNSRLVSIAAGQRTIRLSLQKDEHIQSILRIVYLVKNSHSPLLTFICSFEQLDG